MVNKSKRKGSRREYQMRDWFKELGLRGKRVILSGALGGKFSGDLDLFLPRQRKPIKVEVKGRKTEPAKTLLRWKGDNSMLIVKVDNKPPYFLLDEDLMKLILSRVK